MHIRNIFSDSQPLSTSAISEIVLVFAATQKIAHNIRVSSIIRSAFFWCNYHKSSFFSLLFLAS